MEVLKNPVWLLVEGLFLNCFAVPGWSFEVMIKLC